MKSRNSTSAFALLQALNTAPKVDDKPRMTLETLLDDYREENFTIVTLTVPNSSFGFATIDGESVSFDERGEHITQRLVGLQARLYGETEMFEIDEIFVDGYSKNYASKPFEQDGVKKILVV